MSRRIIVWGATGYTGALTAQALAEAGAPGVVLAGRNRQRLDEVAGRLPGEQTVAVADSAEPGTLRPVVRPNDVLIATVGPFTRYGWAAAQLCAELGATYLDSTGEPPFIRKVADRLTPVAERSGAMLAPAFGYDFVPGQLAAVHALEAAPEATGVRVGYFTAGSGARRLTSGGTAASIAAMLGEPSYAWQRGRMVTERPAARVTSFPASGKSLTGISIGGAEHLFLPRSFGQLRDVDVYLGWSGRQSRLVQLASALTSPLTRLPGAATAVDRVTSRLAPGSTGGPSPADRSRVLTRVIAYAVGEAGVLARCELRGPNPYELTAELLAQAARRLRSDDVRPPAGVLGPAELFGVHGFRQLGKDVGLSEVD